MGYEELVLDAKTPQRVALFIQEAIEPHFHDIHCMLRLPLPEIGLDAGCNFAIAQVLLNIISGVSTTLYEQEGRSGALFHGLMTDFYWPIDPPTGLTDSEASSVLYKEYRNIMVHAMGLAIRMDPKTNTRVLEKSSARFEIARLPKQTEAFLHDIEFLDQRPVGLGPTLVRDSSKTVLLVEGLYWGVRRMIERLSVDCRRMHQADLFLSPVVRV